MSQYVTLELKRGLASDWAARNPILAPGEPGIELDTDTLKIGDGVTPWNDLEILRFGTSVAVGKGTGVNQGANSIAIGLDAGTNQGRNSISIGNKAGTQIDYSVSFNPNPPYGLIYTPLPPHYQADNTIVLDATGYEIAGVNGQTGSFYVAPIRQDLTKTIPLLYDPATYEIVQGTPATPITLADTGSFTLDTADPGGWPYSSGAVGVTFLGPYTPGLYSFEWASDGLQFGNGSIITYYPENEGFKGGYDFGGPTNIQVFGNGPTIGFVNYGSPGTWNYWLHKFTNS